MENRKFNAEYAKEQEYKSVIARHYEGKKGTFGGKTLEEVREMRRSNPKAYSQFMNTLPESNFYRLFNANLGPERV